MKSRFFPAKIRTSPFLIVLLHHLGGQPEYFKQHLEFLNQAGFDAYIYPAFLSGKTRLTDILPTTLRASHKLKIVTTWQKELNQHLDSLPQEKIIYSFSLPSLAALLCASERKDIKALVCEGGPFIQIPLGAWRLFTHYEPCENIFLKIYLSLKLSLAFEGFSLSQKKKKLQRLLPKSLPVLSLQAEQDLLVPPSKISKFFKGIHGIQLTRCFLKKSPHVAGLKTERDFYIKNVLAFLEKQAK